MALFVAEYERYGLLFGLLQQKESEAADELVLPVAFLGDVIAQLREMFARDILPAVAQQVGEGAIDVDDAALPVNKKKPLVSIILKGERLFFDEAACFCGIALSRCIVFIRQQPCVSRWVAVCPHGRELKNMKCLVAFFGQPSTTGACCAEDKK